jgi:CBS domain-containing protein
MNAADIMTREVVSVDAQTSIAEAGRLMLQHRISGLPVTDESGKVIGVITEGDLLHRAELGTERRHRHWIELLMGPGRSVDNYVDAHARKVGEVMTETVVSVTPLTELSDIVRLMETRNVKRVPVVESGRLVGIVSRANLVRALVHRLVDEQAASARGGSSDSKIRADVLAIIEHEPWAPRYSITVAVENGVVDLRGSITDERERAALKVAAETVSGVKAVHDHLVWVEPTTGLTLPAADGGDPRPAD